ncbi:MAG: ATP-binding protein, partial [Spirochaetaceae bacterium]|nr:ATP-binding protein [Spirochaetaceae bacterium]
IAPRRILKNLDAVSQEVERLNKIVMDFLFAVRPMEITPEKTNLADFMHEILDFVRGELAAAKITVEEKFSHRLPRVCIDKKAIRQAVLNIIMNAKAAMPQGGTLTVSTGKKEDCVRLVISDTGEGIPLENQDKIFEPYFTTKTSGAGLGLTNVFKILKEHKADISVDSQPGKGAAFIIIFPLPKGETHLLEYVRGGEDFA